MENKLEVLAVLLTNRCNLKCIYCGRNENKDNSCAKQELTADEWINIFEDAKTVGLKKVNMTGGEIFCRKDVLEIIERTINLGLDVSIETNGTVVTEEQIKYLSRFKDHLSISISLDGIRKTIMKSWNIKIGQNRTKHFQRKGCDLWVFTMIY